jgi:lysozyme
MANRKKTNPPPLTPRRLIWLTVAIGMVVLAGYGYWRLILNNHNQWTHSFELGIRLPMRYELHGLDVSKFQGAIRWSEVKAINLPQDARLGFVFVKATEGATLLDKRFQQNFAALRQHNITRGAYHFYIPWRDPVAQANNFVRNVKLSKGDLPPVLDIEVNALKPDREIIRDLHTWLTLVEKHFGKKPIIYTNQHFYLKFVKGHLDEYPLWIADYSKEQLDQYPDEQLFFWQHSQVGWVPGIKGKVDFNVFLKKTDDFEELLID